MMKITVNFFAAYREAVGQQEIDMNVEESGITAEDLFTRLRDRFPALERFPAARVAINDELVPWSTTLSDGDQVLVFPPVAGG